MAAAGGRGPAKAGRRAPATAAARLSGYARERAAQPPAGASVGGPRSGGSAAPRERVPCARMTRTIREGSIFFFFFRQIQGPSGRGSASVRVSVRQGQGVRVSLRQGRGVRTVSVRITSAGSDHIERQDHVSRLRITSAASGSRQQHQDRPRRPSRGAERTAQRLRPVQRLSGYARRARLRLAAARRASAAQARANDAGSGYPTHGTTERSEGQQTNTLSRALRCDVWEGI